MKLYQAGSRVTHSPHVSEYSPGTIKTWRIGAGKELELHSAQPRIMGILNITPDSFFDGGQYDNLEIAYERVSQIVFEGADIVDIGGESSRPGAITVDSAEEAERVIPLVSGISQTMPDTILSVDTYKADIALEAVGSGAHIINDISGGLIDPGLFEAVAETGAGYVLMHMRGTPQTMQKDTGYCDLIDEINDYFEKRLSAAVAAGVDEDRIVIDPGIGFGKSAEDNYRLINNLGSFAGFGRPILLGPSRKSFLSLSGQRDAKDRLEGTLAAVTVATMTGADILRVHDVAQVRKATSVATRFMTL